MKAGGRAVCVVLWCKRRMSTYDDLRVVYSHSLPFWRAVWSCGVSGDVYDDLQVAYSYTVAFLLAAYTGVLVYYVL